MAATASSTSASAFVSTASVTSLRSSGLNARRQPAGRQRQCVRLNTMSVATTPSSGSSPAALPSFGVVGSGKARRYSPDSWRAMHEALTANEGFESMTPEQTVAMLDKMDVAVVDIRPADEYAEGHAPGAVNVPLFRAITEWTPWKILRRAGFAFFGIFNGTEENPEFLDDMRRVMRGKSGVVLMCASGGHLEASVHLPLGKQSRSLIAAYELLSAGYSNVKHVKGGVWAWTKAGLPVEVSSA